MRKALVSIAFSVILLFQPVTALAEENFNHNKAEMEKPQVELSKEQRAELQKLYEKKMKLEKKIIDKYVDFGVLSEEAASKIREHKEGWFGRLKENGFIMPH